MANDVQKRNAVMADLESLIGKHSLENGSGTPGFVLAGYLYGCLQAWEEGVKARDRWWSFTPKIGGIIPAVDDPKPDLNRMTDAELAAYYQETHDLSEFEGGEVVVPDKPVHTYPTDDIIEHDTDGGNCPCKPTIEAVVRDDGSVGQHVIHNALDGRKDA